MKKSILAIATALVVVPLTVFAVTEDSVQRQSRSYISPRVQSGAEEVQLKVKEMNAAREEQRDRIRAQVLEKVKESAQRSITRQESRYEKIRKRVFEMPNISDDIKNEISDQIVTDLIAINNLKIEVEMAESTEEVRAAVEKLKTTLRASKTAVRAKVEGIHATRLSEAVKVLESVLARLEVKIEQAEKNNKDVAGLMVLSEDVKEQIADSKERISTKNFPEAKESILGARKILIELSQQLKALI